MFLSKNLKYLRKIRHGMSQSELANMLKMTRSAFSSYEEGRAEPKLERLEQIANYFSITLDQLISKDLEKMQDEELLQQENVQKYISAENLRILTISVSKDDENENVELVPEKAAAGYTKGYADVEYIKDLPKYKLPFLSKEKTYRAFEVTGDSMLPLLPGMIVVGEYVQDWSGIKSGEVCVVVSRSQGIVLKKIYSRIKERQTLLLKSSNIHYSPYELPVEEVLEIWRFVVYISKDIPNEQTSIDDLREAFNRLEEDFHNFKMRDTRHVDS